MSVERHSHAWNCQTFGLHNPLRHEDDYCLLILASSEDPALASQHENRPIIKTHIMACSSVLHYYLALVSDTFLRT